MIADILNIKISEMIFEHDNATNKIVSDNRDIFEQFVPKDIAAYDNRQIKFDDLINALCEIVDKI